MAVPIKAGAAGCFQNIVGSNSYGKLDNSTCNQLTDTAGKIIDPSVNCYLQTIANHPSAGGATSPPSFAQKDCSSIPTNDIVNAPQGLGTGQTGVTTTSCSGDKDRGFFGFPKWYSYLPGTIETSSKGGLVCHPVLDNINDFWLIGAAIAEIMLRIASLLAIGYVVFGGVQYIRSQGESDRLKQARESILYAVIGLVISVSAAGIVSYIAGRFK
ncbi:MAG: hypothetical protein NVS1B7_1760 [Candidatus Saccharimonadales bacterium]